MGTEALPPGRLRPLFGYIYNDNRLAVVVTHGNKPLVARQGLAKCSIATIVFFDRGYAVEMSRLSAWRSDSGSTILVM
jgi:hypothetical protein